jgi:hypothetical protein
MIHPSTKIFKINDIPIIILKKFGPLLNIQIMHLPSLYVLFLSHSRSQISSKELQ